MEEELKDRFKQLLERHIDNPYACAAMSLLREDKDYVIDGTALETELAIEVYDRRTRTSGLPQKEIEELKRIVGELKLLNSSEIWIVDVMVKEWSVRRAPAYIFFVTSSLGRLIGVLQSGSPGNIRGRRDA